MLKGEKGKDDMPSGMCIVSSFDLYFGMTKTLAVSKQAAGSKNASTCSALHTSSGCASGG